MAREIDWAAVHSGRLGQDVVSCDQTPVGDRNVIELQLRLPYLTWWKGLLVTNAADVVIRELWVEVGPLRSPERRDSGVARLDWRNIGADGTLEFWKAGWWGIHTHAYTLPTLEPLRGHRTVIRWVTD